MLAETAGLRPEGVGVPCFTDQERDAETDLHYFGARYYDPWIGRFMSQDPELIGPSPGVTFGRIGRDPQQFNTYSYVRNSPTVLTDPTGRQSIIENLGDKVKRIAEKLSESPGAGVDQAGKEAGAMGNSIGAGDAVGEPPSKTLGEAVDSGAEGAAAAKALGGQKAGENATPSDGATSSDGATPTEGVYEFPDQTAGGKPYTGQSENVGERLKQHERAGRYEPGTESTWGVEGGKTKREIAEHRRIQENTGGERASRSDRVANKKDPIGPARRHLLDE